MAEARRPIEVDFRRGVAVVTFNTPILAVEVLELLSSAIDTLAAADGTEPLVLHSAHPGIFLAGAHLAEIALLDTTSSAPYARLGRHIIDGIQGFPAPTVAAIDGTCSGGGFDIALACDALVTGPSARFAHPGVRLGLVTGWSGTTRLPTALGGMGAKTAVLETRVLDAAPLANYGIVELVSEDPLARAFEIARRLASVDPARLRHWRALEGPGFIDRFSASVVHKL